MSKEQKTPPPEGGQLMSEAEVEATRAIFQTGARAPASAPAQEAKPSKLSPAKKNQLLMGAVLSGNLTGVQEALSMGAEINSQQSRSYPYQSVLDVAIEKGVTQECVIELLKNGALCNAGSGKRDGARALAVEAASNPDMAAKARGLIERHLIYAAAPSLMKAVSAHWSSVGIPAPDSAAWMEKCIASREMEKAWEFAKQDGCALKASGWSAIERWAPMASPENPSAREAFMGFIKTQGKSMGAQTALSVYSHAIGRDDLEMVCELMKAGVRPGARWMVERESAHRYSWRREMVLCPILVAARGRGAGSCYEMLRRFTPALELAGEPYNIKALADLSVTDVLELDAVGVRLEGADATGDNVLHVWARADEGAPRSGWPTLVKKKSHLLSAPNAANQSALSVQMSYLKGGAGEEFEKSLARAESAAMIKEIGAAPKANAASKAQKARARL